MTLFRLEFPTVSSASDEQCRANVRYSASLGLPKALHLPKASGRLAVCGGGPSLKSAMDGPLSRWEGDIWAINGTAAHMARNGFAPIFVTAHVGPLPYPVAHFAEGVDRALIASSCMPEMFDAFAGKDIATFDVDVEFSDEPINGGSTTACRIPMLALKRGYREVHFFGCEGSFADQSHAYKSEQGEWDITIEAGGQRYRTNCQMMLQSENLALLIREFPGFLHDRSGGLLAAMIRHPDTWGVCDVPAAWVDA